MCLTEDILKSARKWASLGVGSVILSMEGEHRSKKLIKRSIPVTEKILNSSEGIESGFNFLGVLLKGSGLMCLDVEANSPESVPNFLLLLQERGIDPNTLLMERSLNGGLHVYFRLEEAQIGRKHFQEFSGINFDVLTDFRVFTSPSKYRDKSYEWIGLDFFSLPHKESIPTFPPSLSEMLTEAIK